MKGKAERAEGAFHRRDDREVGTRRPRHGGKRASEMQRQLEKRQEHSPRGTAKPVFSGVLKM